MLRARFAQRKEGPILHGAVLSHPLLAGPLRVSRWGRLGVVTSSSWSPRQHAVSAYRSSRAAAAGPEQTWSYGVSTIKGHSARGVRVCDRPLKGGTSGSSLVRFGLAWGCRAGIGFRFRGIPGTLV